jgi:hypothetical protein
MGISKVCYKIEQFFGITGRHMGCGRAIFKKLIKEHGNRLCQVIAFNRMRVLLSEGYNIQEERA